MKENCMIRDLFRVKFAATCSNWIVSTLHNMCGWS